MASRDLSKRTSELRRSLDQQQQDTQKQNIAFSFRLTLVVELDIMSSNDGRQKAAHTFLGSEVGRHDVWRLDDAVRKEDLN